MVDHDGNALMRAGHVKDARGRPVPIIDPFVMHKLRRHDTIPADALKSIAQELGSGWARQGLWTFSLIWPVVLLCLVAAHFLKWGGGMSAHPRELRLWIVLLALFGINCVIVWYLSRHVRLNRACKVLLHHLRCPHCGYDIRGLPVDTEDGCTVCPECGSAWRVEGERP